MTALKKLQGCWPSAAAPQPGRVMVLSQRPPVSRRAVDGAGRLHARHAPPAPRSAVRKTLRLRGLVVDRRRADAEHHDVLGAEAEVDAGAGSGACGRRARRRSRSTVDSADLHGDERLAQPDVARRRRCPTPPSCARPGATREPCSAGTSRTRRRSSSVTRGGERQHAQVGRRLDQRELRRVDGDEPHQRRATASTLSEQPGDAAERRPAAGSRSAAGARAAPRLAPSAARIAISRRRAAARASSRLATLAQAISSTSADEPLQHDQRRLERVAQVGLAARRRDEREGLLAGSARACPGNCWKYSPFSSSSWRWR